MQEHIKGPYSEILQKHKTIPHKKRNLKIYIYIKVYNSILGAKQDHTASLIIFYYTPHLVY